MIRGRASKPKRRQAPPVFGDLCGCGAPWVVACPGSTVTYALRVNQQGMTCRPLTAQPAIPTILLCLPCAQARGWPNFKSEGDANP